MVELRERNQGNIWLRWWSNNNGGSDMERENLREGKSGKKRIPRCGRRREKEKERSAWSETTKIIIKTEMGRRKRRKESKVLEV